MSDLDAHEMVSMQYLQTVYHNYVHCHEIVDRQLFRFQNEADRVSEYYQAY